MHVREVLEIMADDEEVKDALVDNVECSSESVRVRIPYQETNACSLERPNRGRRDVEVQVVRMIVGRPGANQRHAASGTLVACLSPDVRMHGTPVDKPCGIRCGGLRGRRERPRRTGSPGQSNEN